MLDSFVKKIYIIFILINTVYVSSAQIKRIFICDTTNAPIQYCSFINVSKSLVNFSNEVGYLNIDDNKFTLNDTVLVKHISFLEKKVLVKDLLEIDTLRLSYTVSSLKEVILKQSININDFIYKKEFGLFKRKFDGAYYLHVGQQIGVLYKSNDLVRSLLSKVKLHFSDLNKNSIIKIGVKSVNQDGTIGDDLLYEDVIIKPTSLITIVDFKTKEVFLKDDCVFVYIECISYDESDKTINKIKTINTSNEVKTFTNFMNIRNWTEWTYIIPKKQYPMNAEIQIEILKK